MATKEPDLSKEIESIKARLNFLEKPVPCEMFPTFSSKLEFSYATEGSAGRDIRADLPEGESVTIRPGESKIIPTGVVVLSCPSDIVIDLRSRSGYAANFQVSLTNGVGTVDSDYVSKEIKVIMQNLGREDFTVERNMKIAQVVMLRVIRDPEAIKQIKRNGGLNSTGVK